MPGILDSVGGDHSLEPSPRPLQFYLYKGVAHSSIGGDHSLEPSPRPLQFYLYKGVTHRREGSP